MAPRPALMHNRGRARRGGRARLKAHAWNACRLERVSGVRIPPSPPPSPAIRRNPSLVRELCRSSAEQLSSKGTRDAFHAAIPTRIFGLSLCGEVARSPLLDRIEEPSAPEHGVDEWAAPQRRRCRASRSPPASSRRTCQPTKPAALGHVCRAIRCVNLICAAVGESGTICRIQRLRHT